MVVQDYISKIESGENKFLNNGKELKAEYKKVNAQILQAQYKIINRIWD